MIGSKDGQLNSELLPNFLSILDYNHKEGQIEDVQDKLMILIERECIPL